jgi:hypothetical protein
MIKHTKDKILSEILIEIYSKKNKLIDLKSKTPVLASYVDLADYYMARLIDLANYYRQFNNKGNYHHAC